MPNNIRIAIAIRGAHRHGGVREHDNGMHDGKGGEEHQEKHAERSSESLRSSSADGLRNLTEALM
jgi:hypothetical protein